MKKFLIGGYAQAGGNGILSAGLDTEKGKLTAVPVCTELENPSWILMHPDGNVLYAVEELVPDGRIAVLHQEGNSWKVIKRLKAGSAPCHLALNGAASFLTVSNYMDGTLQVWKLDGNGIPEAMTAEIRHSGKGTDPDRQEGPHIHASLYHDRILYVTDLGLDRVFGYRLNEHDGSLKKEKEFAFPAGGGPRHMAVHERFPDYLYVNTEMGGKAYVVRISDGTILQEQQVVPESFPGIFRVSSIRFAGDVLYIGSRECNMVALFRLKEDGMLSQAVRYSHQQETPRDVWMDDSWCITADEGSGSLTLLKRDGLSLQQAEVVPTPGVRPTCVQEIAQPL